MRTFLSGWLEDRNRGYSMLLIGTVAVLYLPFLSNPFFFDDLTFFGSAIGVYGAPEALLNPRGLPYNTLFWTSHWFGTDLPHAYRLIDALLHAAVALTLFLLVRNLLRSKVPSPACNPAQRRMIDFAAAFGALVFAAHPVATYAAGYVVQRSIVMATLFSLLCLLCHLHALTSGRQRWLLPAVGFYFLSCFSKEHAVGVPLLVAAVTVVVLVHADSQRRRALVPGLIATAIAMAAVALSLVLRMRGVIGTAYEPMATHVFGQSGLNDVESAHLLSIATQTALYFKYLMLWLWPLPDWMSIDMREPFIVGFDDWRVWVGPAAFLLTGLLAIRLLFAGGLAGLLGLGLGWPWLLFLVEFSSVRVQETFVLYRSYLWMPGLMLMFSVLVWQLQRRLASRARTLFALRGALLLVCLALLMPATVNRLQVAADPWRLWDDAARHLANDAVPGADRILYNRGNAALAAGRPADAVSDLERVVAISPDLYQVHHALGLAQYANRDYDGAEESFRRALALKPGHSSLLYAHAVTLSQLGRVDEARQAMLASCAGAASGLACFAAARMQPGRNVADQ